jgi:hypothetical protein
MLEPDGPNHHGMHVLLTLASIKGLPDYEDRHPAKVGALYRTSAELLYQLQSKPHLLAYCLSYIN